MAKKVFEQGNLTFDEIVNKLLADSQASFSPQDTADAFSIALHKVREQIQHKPRFPTVNTELLVEGILAAIRLTHVLQQLQGEADEISQ